MIVRPTPGPLCAAVEAWVAQAIKGETFCYYKGHDIKRVLMPPEQRMSNAQRAAHAQKCRKLRATAKKEGKRAKLPAIPDEFKTIRPDVMSLVELVERLELRGLVEIKTVVLGKNDRLYEMTMLVQRNGLKAVRDRTSK